MRDADYVGGLTLLAGAWTVLRLDGRAFTRFTGWRFEKSFDGRLRELMLRAARTLQGLGNGVRNELAFRHESNFNELPAWQRRGCGLYWETYTAPRFDPVRSEAVEVRRQRPAMDLELPVGEDDEGLIHRLIRARGR